MNVINSITRGDPHAATVTRANKFSSHKYKKKKITDIFREVSFKFKHTDMK